VEKNISVTVKTRRGNLVTFRGDEPEEFVTRVREALVSDVATTIAALEDFILDTEATPTDLVVNAFNGVAEEPQQYVPVTPTFAPVPPPPGPGIPPSGMGTAVRACVHGNMTKREGTGQWGPYKAFYCPTPKGAPDQCKPVYVKPNEADWNNF
jgi:hypothetical protein